MATDEQVKTSGARAAREKDSPFVRNLDVISQGLVISETFEVLAGEHDRIKVYVKDDDGARLAFEGSVEELEALQENVLQAGMELQVGEVTIFVRGHKLLARTPDGKTLTLATLE